MRLTVVGSGDAFGSGGRLNTAFLLETGAATVLIDCGATALVGLKRLGIDRNAIDAILVTHFHADHFGGLPFFILDAQFLAKRVRRLTIAGPEGLAAAYCRALETAFPGSAGTRQRFPLDLVELAAGRTIELAGLRVTPQAVVHGPPGTPCLGLRVEAAGRVVAYTGDTEWTDTLIPLGRDADLMIAEAYFRDKAVPYHLDLASLEARLPEIRPKRLLLTHMSDEMLARRDEVAHEAAFDGMTLTL